MPLKGNPNGKILVIESVAQNRLSTTLKIVNVN